MALKLRLTRGGTKKRPFYSIVVADVRSPRDGRFIEKLGTYNPLLVNESERVVINKDRVSHWLSKGALPTDRVLRFLDAEGIAKREARNNPNKAMPGKKAQERVAEQQQKAVDAEAAALKAAEDAAAAAVAAKADAEAAVIAAAEEKKAAAAAAKAAKAEAAAAAVADPVPVMEVAISFVDDIVLIDGIGEKTAEALKAGGVSTLTAIAGMSDEALAAACESAGAGDQWTSQEWKVQANEMIGGKPPRAKVDQELARKMAAGA